MSGVSGDFGIRLHRGPHYPRSKITREDAQACFSRFHELYPNLIVDHEEAIYAHGISDALGQPSKVSTAAFRMVCHETVRCQEVDPRALGLKEVSAAFKLDEPSVAIGSKLRVAFAERLASSSVEIHLGCEVTSTVLENARIALRTATGASFWFDKVVNATGFQSMIPRAFEENLPLHAEVYYQVNVGLHYVDRYPSGKPISRIVMDGWFPCLMPLVTDDERPQTKYVVTHGSHTIKALCRRQEAAQEQLESLTDEVVESTMKIPAEKEMIRFWPGFGDRFEYVGWKGVSQAKLKTRSEFRNSLTFEHGGVIYVFPGKISNVFDAEDETKSLLAGIGCTERSGIRYALSGVLAKASRELQERPRAARSQHKRLKS
ncbi:MAG: hypothetical protein L6R42_005057 [Xanthoria sp. 1 TBL-2021]|nr:MAG: hypothetical protein L6R42_005057 [Xanthoria sp. 1 TBL-2021]